MHFQSSIFKICVFLFSTGIVASTCTLDKKKAENPQTALSTLSSPLSFTDSKTGDTSLVFIHGWNIDKSYWQYQVDYFSNSYRVVTLDLPGFGKSPKNPEGCSAELFAKDVLQLCAELQLRNIILVGHSMSGAIITEAVTQAPEKILAIVGIDNFSSYDTGYSEKTKKQLAAFFSEMRKNYWGLVKSYSSQYLVSPSTDSLVKARVFESMYRPDSIFSVECLEKIDSYPLGKKLKSLNRPLYLINSDFHPNDTASFRRNGIELHFYNIGPTGHYPMIEKPAEFNRLMHTVIYNAASNRHILQ